MKMQGAVLSCSFGQAGQIKACVCAHDYHRYRVGQNRIYAPYMTVYTVISLPKIPYIHRIYMILANPTYIYGIYGIMANTQSYTVYIYGSGQPYIGTHLSAAGA